MRPLQVLGWGLAGVVAVAAPAAGQFASGRAAPPPAAPQPGVNTPGSPAAPSLAQLTPSAPATPPPSAHPWYVKPECGAWMICVKSYARVAPEVDPKALAEALAKDIRDTYGIPAYLFEKGADEKKKQEAFVAKERAKQEAELQSFRDVAQKVREEAMLKGMDVIESTPRLRIPKYRALDEQWAVLIGGWKDMETAAKELKKVRAWQPPRNADLLDRQMVTRKGPDGRAVGEMAVINPFQFAMVFPNPVAPKVPTEEDAAGRAALVRLNEKEELSALRIAKPWTLVVKSFHPPVRLRDKDGEKSVVERLFARDEGAKELHASAQQAVSFAKALRDPKFKPHPFDAYVLHTTYGTIVTVGQFDAAEDAALYQTAATLEKLTFEVRREDQVGVKSNVQLFDPMFAMPIPRMK